MNDCCEFDARMEHTSGGEMFRNWVIPGEFYPSSPFCVYLSVFLYVTWRKREGEVNGFCRHNVRMEHTSGERCLVNWVVSGAFVCLLVCLSVSGRESESREAREAEWEGLRDEGTGGREGKSARGMDSFSSFWTFPILLGFSFSALICICVFVCRILLFILFALYWLSSVARDVSIVDARPSGGFVMPHFSSISFSLFLSPFLFLSLPRFLPSCLLFHLSCVSVSGRDVTIVDDSRLHETKLWIRPRSLLR